MSDGTGTATDLRGLENDYEILGELRGTDDTRRYIARRKGEPPAEVAITVLSATPEDRNALAHFASDVQQLQQVSHPSIARVIEGRWLGSDAFAVVNERVIGETLDERLERGEKFTNPRIAMMLQDVSGVLDWARENSIIHRGVTPATMFFDRGSNRLRVSLVPTPIAMSGIPDACGDARTIGMLAWAILTGQPYERGETRSLADVCPNLATRLVEATDRMIRCKDHVDAPDVSTYLGVLAAGDVLKQAEVELLAQKEEYDELHRIEIQKCELQRQETEEHAAEQAAMLAGERQEFERAMADERAQLETERLQVEAALAERKQRLGAVRAELDQQRGELERRLAELEAYRAEVERLRDDALEAREAAKAAQARAAEAAAAHQAALKAAAQASPAVPTTITDDDFTPRTPAKATPAMSAAALPVMPAVPELEPLKPQKLAKPPKPPKWSKIERVDLEHTDNVVVGETGRPRWMVPAGVATLVLILVAALYGMTYRSRDNRGAMRFGKTAPTAMRGGMLPRGGFLTQSAGGSLAPKLSGSPLAKRADSVSSASSTSGFGGQSSAAASPETDSAAARQRRAAARLEAAREAAAAARHRPTQAEIDSMNTPPRLWNSTPQTPVPPPRRPDDSTLVRRDSFVPPRLALPARIDTLARRDSTVRRDTIRPRPDTGAIQRR